MSSADDLLGMQPDTEVSARFFGVPNDMKVPAFSRRTEYVPESDPSYRFDPDTTLAILAGFAFKGDASASDVPEPTSLFLLLFALALLFLTRARRPFGVTNAGAVQFYRRWEATKP